MNLNSGEIHRLNIKSLSKWPYLWRCCRLDYQPLFGKGARAPPPKAGEERHERAAEIEPSVVAAALLLGWGASACTFDYLFNFFNCLACVRAFVCFVLVCLNICLSFIQLLYFAVQGTSVSYLNSYISGTMIKFYALIF